MSRKSSSQKRQVPPDVKFNSVLVSKFINNIMEDGKKAVAEKIFYSALDLIQEKVQNQNPFELFNQAVENVKPVLEVKSRRVGGANYQVPVEVRPERKNALAIRWILGAATSRPEKTMKERLANELIDAFNNTGISVKKKEDTHKMAEANKAFAHYRW